MLLLLRFNVSRSVANSSPVKSVMPLFGASSRVKRDISAWVIAAFLALPKMSSITARKLLSGIFTTAVTAMVKVSVAVALFALFAVSV